MKTKIGISLTALACFVAFNMGCGKSDSAPKEDVRSKDSNVMKVIETLQANNQQANLSYQLPDGRTIKFYYSSYDYQKQFYDPVSKEGRKAYLELRISKKSKEDRTVIIRDYDLNSLDGEDEVVIEKTTYGGWIIMPMTDTRVIGFGELSAETQNEIKKEYDAIIKEAPQRLSEENKKLKQEIERREEQRKKEFEKNILDILKDKGEKMHDSFKYWWE